MTVSLWRRRNTLGVIRCEAAVIGAGISGIAAALAFERRGIDALVIDRGPLGFGASTRNAGFLMRGAADNYAFAARHWGRERAREVWRWTEDNLRLLREEGIESLATYRATPSCLLGLEPVEAGELEASDSLMREDGFEVGLIRAGRDAAWSSGVASVGLVNPHDATINSADLIAFLGAKLRRPAMLHQEVTGIEIVGVNDVRILTANAEVRCERAMVCTNAFTGLLLPGLREHIHAKRGQMLAFRTPGRIFDHAYYANRGGEYFRQATDDVAVLGGWRRFFTDIEVGYEDRTTDEVQRGLESFMMRVLGGPIDVVARWSGVMGFTPDELPLVGPIDASGRPQPEVTGGPLWLSAGCTGHGMSIFFKTAGDAVRCMLDGRTSTFALAQLVASV